VLARADVGGEAEARRPLGLRHEIAALAGAGTACKSVAAGRCDDMLDLNAPAPPFTLEGTHAGRPRRVSLSEFRGKWVVLFFYPADFTFVCPTEVVGFGKRLPEFEALQAQVLGVSVDDVETHRAWAAELGGVSFPLLSDATREVCRAYEVLNPDDQLRGVSVATQDRRVVVITGLAAGVTGGISMATGSYLAARTERDIFEREFRDQEQLAAREPYLAQEALLESLTADGLDRPSAYRVVATLSRREDLLLRTVQEKVLGLSAVDLSQPLKAGLVMFVSFVIGALIPVVPFFLP